MQKSFTKKFLARQPFMDFKKAKNLLNMGPLQRKRLLSEKHIHVSAGPMQPAVPAAAAAAAAAASPGANKRKRSSNPGRRQQPGMLANQGLFWCVLFQSHHIESCSFKQCVSPRVVLLCCGHWFTLVSCCSIPLPHLSLCAQDAKVLSVLSLGILNKTTEQRCQPIPHAAEAKILLQQRLEFLVQYSSPDTLFHVCETLMGDAYISCWHAKQLFIPPSSASSRLIV